MLGGRIVASVALLVSAAAWAETVAKYPVAPLPLIVPTRASPDAGYANILAQTTNCDAVLRNQNVCADDARRYCLSPTTAAAEMSADALLTASTCTGANLTMESSSTRSKMTAPTPTELTGTWQETVIRGIAAFLASRAEAEALASLISNLQATICGEPRLQPLFVSTCTLVAASQNRTAIAWGTMKAAVESDLNALPYSLPTMLFPNDDPASAERREFLISVAAVLHQTLIRGEDPILVLGGLEPRYREALKHTGERDSVVVRRSLLLLGIVAQLVEPGVHSSVGLNDAQWARYGAIAARWYLPRALKDAKLIDATRADTEITIVLQPVMSAARELVARSDQQASNESADERAARIRALTQAVATFFELPASVLAVVGTEQDRLAATQLASASRLLVDAMDAGRSHDYPRLVTDVLRIATLPGSKLPDGFLKYAGFLAEVAGAKTPEEVQRALDAAAAPVGSWRNKRGGGHHAFTINGYVGLQGGAEMFAASGLPIAPSFQASLMGAVGVEASIGFCDAWSFGVFASVIDVGALVNFRAADRNTTQKEGELSDIKVDQTPNFGFAQVFSPGLYLTLGFPSTPITLGVGGAMTPQLRRTTLVGTDTTRDLSVFRVGAFVAIDLTIFEF